MSKTTDDTCRRCEGCGRLGSDDDHAPWTAWEALPPGSDMAVRLGLVTPITCWACDGTGKKRKEADRARA